MKNPFKLLLSKIRKNPASKRPRLLVHFNTQSGQFTDFEMIHPLSTQQMNLALTKLAVEIADLTRSANQKCIADFIEKQSKEAALGHKILGKAATWKKQSLLVIPKEVFVGQSSNHLFSCQIDGSLKLLSLKINNMEPFIEKTGNVHVLLNEAIEQAKELSLQRWQQSLKGKLEEELELKETIRQEEKKLLQEANERINNQN